MFNNLYIGSDKIDLFKDESTEITSSVSNINDITKNMTDYSKSFTVPATHNNNRIFKHYYDANIDNAFDARIKHDGRIELDGLHFKFGKWKLEKVSVKKGNPFAYTITFFGNLVSLKDKLKNFELKDLDLSAYDHVYNSENVRTGLTTSLFGGALVYNLFSKKQLYYRSGSENVNTDKLANIAFSGGANTGVNWNLLRPSIQLIKIIEAIENDFNITFSRDFFGRVEFQNLYVWANNNASIINRIEERINFTNTGDISGDWGVIDVLEDSYVSGSIRKTAYFTITPSAGYETVNYSIERKLNGEPWGGYSDLVGTQTRLFRIDVDDKKHTFFISTNDEFKFTSEFILENPFIGTRSAEFPEQTINGQFQVANNLPKIKLIDLLSGLFKMFKLVVIADNYNNIYVETQNNYYAQGSLIDISRYVKTDSIDVSRGNLLNEINFKFKDPTTILNSQFKKITSQGYGDEATLLTDDGTPSGTPLEGDSLTIDLPFEQIIYERLPDLNGGEMTNIMYGAIIDEKLEPVSPDLHIFYNQAIPIGATKPIGFINDEGDKEILISPMNINTPSHSIDFTLPDFNLNFGIENNEWDNTQSEKTLYSNYYANYIENIFNIKRRNFDYKAILPLRIMLRLKLNDVLKIKGNYYRIDNYTYNLLSGETSFNLINIFDYRIGNLVASPNQLFATYLPQTMSISVSGFTTGTAVLDDDSWLSVSIVGSNFFFEFSENETISDRANSCLITDSTTGNTVEVLILQYVNDIPDAPTYCATWESGVDFFGSFDFTPSSEGRTINFTLSTGQINSYTVDGVVIYDTIPLTFTNPASTIVFFNEADLGSIVTQLEFTINIVWSDSSELSLTSSTESITGAFEGCV